MRNVVTIEVTDREIILCGNGVTVRKDLGLVSTSLLQKIIHNCEVELYERDLETARQTEGSDITNCRW